MHDKRLEHIAERSLGFGGREAEVRPPRPPHVDLGGGDERRQRLFGAAARGQMRRERFREPAGMAAPRFVDRPSDGREAVLEREVAPPHRHDFLVASREHARRTAYDVPTPAEEGPSAERDQRVHQPCGSRPDQIRSIDKSRLRSRIERLTASELAAVEDALRITLDLHPYEARRRAAARAR